MFPSNNNNQKSTTTTAAANAAAAVSPPLPENKIKKELCFDKEEENDENVSPNKPPNSYLKINETPPNIPNCIVDAKSIKLEELKEQRRIAKEAKDASDKEYKSKQQEQIYKRLMHLSKKSKFYSSFLMKKIQGEEDSAGPIGGKLSPLKNTRSQKAKNKKPVKSNILTATGGTRRSLRKRLNDGNRKIENELNSTLDSSIDDTALTEEPKYNYFKGNLREYQQIGLKWLIALHENGLNGILADEMGLGKTIQTIAFICHLMEQKIAGPYLIVVPLSVVPNWQIEFNKFAPNIPLITLHGNQASRDKQMAKIKKTYKLENNFVTNPVVIATYESIIFEKQGILNNKWKYIVVDEGHRLKNINSQLHKMLKQCKSIHRLLLTGTPLQNDLSELWSLLNFLMPEVFDDLDVFESWFNAKDLLDKEGTEKFLEQEKENQIVTHLREILKPFMLRRLKSDVCPDILLKKEVVIYAPMTDVQRELYTALLNRNFHELAHASSSHEKKKKDKEEQQQTILKRKKLSPLKADDDEKNKSRLLRSATLSLRCQSEQNKQLIELEKIWAKHVKVTHENSNYLSKMNNCQRSIVYKKIVNHPFLIDCPLDDINGNLIKSSGKFLVLDALLKKLHERGHKVLLFSTWTRILDYIEDYLDTRPWTWTRLDGKYNIQDRQASIELFNNDPNVFLFLITTRAGGVGLNLMGADTVIIFDSDWNPQADIQAMARCHRIGQTRPVIIYKLCTKGSYDELIVDRAAAKRKLEKLVISKELNSLDINDKDSLLMMKELLKKSEHEIVDLQKGIFTDEELEKLLDRSDLINKPNGPLVKI